MRPSPVIPRPSAEALSRCLDAVRVETAALVAAGLLAVSADDLIGGATDVREWLADLDGAIRASRTTSVPLPTGREGGLQQVVYTLSAVLVWAAELRDEGRVVSRVGDDALAAWAAVEEAAGLPEPPPSSACAGPPPSGARHRGPPLRDRAALPGV